MVSRSVIGREAKELSGMYMVMGRECERKAGGGRFFRFRSFSLYTKSVLQDGKSESESSDITS